MKAYIPPEYANGGRGLL